MTNFFDSAYRTTAPWDTGAPQPALIALLDEFPPAGPALDVGCGTGTLSWAIARRGLRVLGVDLAEAAIEQARAKAAAAELNVAARVTFQVADALHPSQLPGPFGAVVDTGFFHLFGPAERQTFAHELAATLAPGGRYYLLGFAIQSPFPNAPRQVREDELRTLFAAEQVWHILALRPAHFQTRSPLGEVPAIAACVQRVVKS
jgi:cyclopropane fatty-acyl-phospholipid synthase-like methyltransferase